MKKIFHNLLILILFTFISTCSSQSENTLYVAFWNLQNLFDTMDDPEKNDEEFLPGSEIDWNDERLDKKMYNLSRVIRSMNSRKGPDVLGICEVENQIVLEHMVDKYLNDLEYKVAYIESPDNRGIDNGLIYKSSKFKLLNVQADTVQLTDGWPTRLIFGANLLTKNDKKITVFVNHWPSRRGGQEESEPNRIAAANTLRESIERIFHNEHDAVIFIIGDFNDEPTNTSLINTLNAKPILCDFAEDLDVLEDNESKLFNISFKAYMDGLGTYKYKDDWNMFDQIIVSRSLISDTSFYYICDSFEIYKPFYIVTQSGDFKGTPFPTYGGRRYLGGYSDHFPVIAKFYIKHYSD